MVWKANNTPSKFKTIDVAACFMAGYLIKIILGKCCLVAVFIDTLANILYQLNKVTYFSRFTCIEGRSLHGSTEPLQIINIDSKASFVGGVTLIKERRYRLLHELSNMHGEFLFRLPYGPGISVDYVIQNKMQNSVSFPCMTESVKTGLIRS